MNVSFRPIRDADREFLFHVYASTRTEELAVTGWSDVQKAAFLDMQFNAQHTYYQQQFPDASYQVVLLNGTSAGRLYVDRTTDEIKLIDIALLPEFRNAGVGTKLLNDLIAEARKTNKPIVIYVEKPNPALRLYQRLGFEPIADQGVYWLMQWRPEADV